MAFDPTEKRYLNPKTGAGPFRLDVRPRRPNILLITLDMVPPEMYLPDYGDYRMRTPNLDRLRSESVFFSNAFSSYPLCAPSRASYLTGRYAYIVANGERSHDGQEIHLRDDDVIYPEYLRAAGYHTRQVGKSHVGRNKFIHVFSENNSPWDRWSPPWFDDDAYYAFLRGRGLERFSFERSLHGEGPGRKGRGNFYGGWLAPQNGKPFPLEATYPAFLVDRTLRALEAWDPARGPFYQQLDFFAPHQPFAIPGGMEEREREIRKWMDLPESYRQWVDNGFSAPWPEPKVYRLYRSYWGLYDPRAVLDYRVANVLQVEVLDTVIGTLLDQLRRRGLYDDTWIFLIADHGEMNGEAGLIDKGVYLQPNILRVPIIVKPAARGVAEGASGTAAGASAFTGSEVDVFTAGTTVSTPASLLDLSPTILEIVGVESEQRRDGLSLFELARLKRRPEEYPILFEGGNHVVPNICVGVHYADAGEGREHLFVYNVMDDLDQLYRLDGAAAENRNLLPERGDLLEEAVRALHEVLRRDPRWVVYNESLRLEKPELLPPAEADAQIFWR
jgi:arylsulfatase A-like enzyme